MSFRVLDSPFNRANYPTLIGKVLSQPPGYANVSVVNEGPTASPWDKEDNGERKYFTKEEQEKKLPTRLGHGWFSDVYTSYTEDQIETEAVRVRDTGHHIALFKEGPRSYRLWYSEVATADPIDRGNIVSRWFDYRFQ